MNHGPIQRVSAPRALSRLSAKFLCLMLSMGLAGAGQAAAGDDRFSCRDFRGYRVIDLNENSYQETFVFRSDEDVLFLGPDSPRRKYLRIDGGRHVAVLGGSFAPSYGYNTPTAAIGTKNQSGSIWIEGVSIDNEDSYGSDGIVLNAAGGKAIPATVLNTSIVNVQGTEGGRHGDIIQPQGRISLLDIENLVGSTSYQGLFLTRQEGVSYGGKVERIKLKNVQLEHLPGGDKRCLYLIAVGGNQQIELDNVYLTRQPHVSHCSGGSFFVQNSAKVTGSPEYGEPESAELSGASVTRVSSSGAGKGKVAAASYRTASGAACGQ